MDGLLIVGALFVSYRGLVVSLTWRRPGDPHWLGLATPRWSPCFGSSEAEQRPAGTGRRFG
jgi:hypothetical protein